MMRKLVHVMIVIACILVILITIVWWKWKKNGMEKVVMEGVGFELVMFRKVGWILKVLMEGCSLFVLFCVTGLGIVRDE